MRIAIKWKFILGYLVLLAGGMGILDIGGERILYKRMLEQETNTLYEEARQLCTDYVKNTHVLEENADVLENQILFLEDLTGLRVWLVSSSGEIVMDSRKKESCRGKNINAYDQKFLENQSLVGAHPAGLIKESMVSVIYPMTEWLETKGYVVVMKEHSLIEKKTFRYTDGLMLCYLVVMALVGAVLFILYFRLVPPLKKLTRATREYADGHFNNLFVEKLPREQKELADAINYLSGRLQSLSEYQKQFIANVSHDFRSPLTSIKGYAEAMADGTIPAELQEKYFHIILQEVERLTKLTGNLLELNQLDYQGLTLEWSRFNINEVIQNTAAAFEQRCMKKQLTLDLVFESAVCMVWGDIGKIQQVLQNLLDNAIKFSQSDSVIEVHTTERRHKVFVSVKDHGAGIPKDNIPKVWTRFYKTDSSRGKDKTGTGLGLSITREIIDAHGENINVISTEGVGTEFIFSLPVKKRNHDEKNEVRMGDTYGNKK